MNYDARCFQDFCLGTTAERTSPSKLFRFGATCARPQLMSPFPVLKVVTGVCIVRLQNSMHCAAKLADQVLLEVQVGSDVHTGGEDVVARLTVIAMVVRVNLFYANR